MLENAEKKGKIIFIDWSIFVHRSIFAWRRNKQIPPEYTCLNMILSSLRRVGIEPFDDIILACDKGRSWRKEVDKEYKANRKEFRKTFEDINWKEMYGRFDNLLEKINRGTDWKIVKANHIEADDWMAVGCRYFKDKEIVLITYDADMEQLSVYDNVKLFSPLIKLKGGKGAYKIIKDPYKILAKKIKKESADNLVSPILNEEDYDKRQSIVSLLELPDYVEGLCQETLSLIMQENKDINLTEVPYNKIRMKIANLYNDKEKIVTYEECLNKSKKTKSKKTKRKKQKEKNIRRERNGTETSNRTDTR